MLRSVTVTTKGPINVVGSKVDIPITLNNSLDQAVTVRVQVVPSNGRLVVGNDVEAVIDADSARDRVDPGDRRGRQRRRDPAGDAVHAVRRAIWTSPR